jgi:predicted amidohydrolase
MSRKIRVSAIGHDSLRAKVPLSISSTVSYCETYLLEQLSQVIPDKPDIIILPEICDIPYGISPQDKDELINYLAIRSNKILSMLTEFAHQHHCYITYPTLWHTADGTLHNTVIMLDRSGKLMGKYDKCHPTPWELETGIMPGIQPYIAVCDFGSVGFAICFDLNFEELCEHYAKAKPDVIAFCSMYHGGLMQRYWAYACRAHLVGAIGGVGGFVISPVGEYVASSTNYFNYTSTIINLDSMVVHLDYNWQRINAMRAKYGTAVSIFDPGFLGAVLISSESDKFTVQDLKAEFEMESLDEYLKRTLKLQDNKRLSQHISKISSMHGSL